MAYRHFGRAGYSYHQPAAPRLTVDNFDKLVAELSKEPDLSEFESGFIASVQAQYTAKGGLTAKQAETFGNIVKKHSKDAKQVKKSWNANFSTTMREKWNFAILMYAVSPYYTRIVLQGKDPSYTPTEGEYLKLTGNKYFSRAWAEHQKPAKFSPGDLVLLPKSPRYTHAFFHEACQYLEENKLQADRYMARKFYGANSREEYLIVVGCATNYVSGTPCVGMRGYLVQRVTVNSGQTDLLGQTFLLQERLMKAPKKVK